MTLKFDFDDESVLLIIYTVDFYSHVIWCKQILIYLSKKERLKKKKEKIMSKNVGSCRDLERLILIDGSLQMKGFLEGKGIF